MHDATRTTFATQRTPYACAPATAANDADIHARLKWLVAFFEAEDRRRSLFRYAREEQEMLSMRRPLTTQQAYRRLGMLLGLLPPAAIFLRLFGFEWRLMFQHSAGAYGLLLLCLLMNLICCLVGRAMGGKLGAQVDGIERRGWTAMLALSVLLGIFWAGVTGASGGLVFFGIGAMFGVGCALPVGAAGFAAFTSLHRLIARGGMIDARHFWPLAGGVTLALTASILSPYLFP